MARDLIPPPSPAGQSTSTVTPTGVPHLIELPPEPPRQAAEPAMEHVYEPSQFRHRFGFLMGALGGVLVAIVAVTVGVIAWGGTSGGDENLAKDWSAWHPSDDSADAGAQQIAEKVGAEYKQANGQQLVKVTGGPLPVPVTLQATTGQTKTYDGNAVLYMLDGLGPNGSIKDGEPSVTRGELVRREALELALYTFRYLPSVDTVVTLMPPPRDAAGAPSASPTPTGSATASASGTTGTEPDPSVMTAMFYRPGDLKGRLQIPLSATLHPTPPLPEEQMGAQEHDTVDQLTGSNIFNWSVPVNQIGQQQLVLSPLKKTG